MLWIRTRRLAVALIAASALLGAAACGTEGGTVLKLYLKETGGFMQAVPQRPEAEGFKPGDQIVEDNPLFDQTDKQVGSDLTAATVIRTFGPDPFLFFDCQDLLEGGTITWSGTTKFSALMGEGATFAITGGTGKYAGAGGWLKVAAGKRGGEEVFNFEFHITD